MLGGSWVQSAVYLIFVFSRLMLLLFLLFTLIGQLLEAVSRIVRNSSTPASATGAPRQQNMPDGDARQVSISHYPYNIFPFG